MVIVLPSVSCGTNHSGDQLAKFAPNGHEGFARAFLDTVRAGHLDAAASELAPGMRERIPGVVDSLWRAEAWLPKGPIDTIRLVGVNSLRTSSVSRSRFNYELHTPHG